MTEWSTDQQMRLEALKVIADAGRMSIGNLNFALQEADILVEYIKRGRRPDGLARPGRARL